MPCPKQKDITFKSFIKIVEKKGYTVAYKELEAHHFGTPTIRKKLFLIARCDGWPIVFPVAIFILQVCRTETLNIASIFHSNFI